MRGTEDEGNPAGEGNQRLITGDTLGEFDDQVRQGRRKGVR